MTRPMTTLKTGEPLRVDLKGRNRTGTIAFTGVVTIVDDRGIRLEPAIDVFTIGGSLPTSRRMKGAEVIPWSSVRTVSIEDKEKAHA